jgi:hypothetical protein
MSLRKVFLLTAFVAAFSVPAAAQKEKEPRHKTAIVANAPAVLWQAPADIASRDLFYGAGRKGGEPRGPFTFVEEDLNGTSPKFIVHDGNGEKWIVKLGVEARPETAASRFLWAVGYFTNEDYFLPEIRVENMKPLRRQPNLVSPDGTVRGVRLKLSAHKGHTVGDWSWFDNPFAGKREFNGLRALMAFLNNWDLKTDNNKFDCEDGVECRYFVSDVGASFGKTGSKLTHSKGNLEDYQQSGFIKSATPESVDFVLHSRPPLLWIFDLKYYLEKTKIEKIARHIPRADAAWIGGLLGQLTEDQIRDAFRGAGFETAEIEGYTKTVRDRIAVLNDF